MKPLLFLLLLLSCIQSFAAIIFVRNQPMPLEYIHEEYYWPANFNMEPGTTTFYITMDGINKVCFLNTGVHGLFEQKSEISIIIKGIKTEWNCFPYRTTILEVRP